MIPLATEILQTAYQQMGIKIEILQVPGARANSLIRYGEVDGELFHGIKFEKVLDNVIRIPVAIAQGQIMAFSLEKEMKVNGWDSLKGYRVGALIRMKDNVPETLSAQINYIKSPELLFKMLYRGRINVAIAPRRLGQFFLAKMGFSKKIVMISPPVQQDNLYHYLDRKHLNIVPELIKILQRMKDSGEIERINQLADSKLINEIESFND